MGNLTQTTSQVQTDLDAVEASNVGLDSVSDLSDTAATAATKSGMYGLGASSSNAPSTDRSVIFTAARDVDAVGEIRRGQVVLTEGNQAWWNVDDGGTLGTWKKVAARNENNSFSAVQSILVNINSSSTADITNTASSGVQFGLNLDFSSASPDDNTSWFLRCDDSTTTRAFIYSDGDLQNHDNSYGAISDGSTKDGIIPATSQKEDIKKLAKIAKKYRNKHDIAAYGDEAKVQLGFIAEDVEKVSPGLVKSYAQYKLRRDDNGKPARDAKGQKIYDPDGELKGVVYSVAYMKALVALGELIEDVEKLTERVDKL